jgi:hypothetical protein
LDLTGCSRGVAILAAFFAYAQVKSFRLFELLKYIQDPKIQEARRVVFDRIEGHPKEVWMAVPELMEAAGIVCASYDILGRVLSYHWLGRVLPRLGLAGFYIRHWAPSIVRTHRALAPYLELRRATNGPNYLSGFDWLRKQALAVEPSLSQSPTKTPSAR